MQLTNGGTSIIFRYCLKVDFADLSFTGVTLTARGALIYNDTQSGDPAVCVLNFGGDKTATAGTFTVQFPAFFILCSNYTNSIGVTHGLSNQ